VLIWDLVLKHTVPELASTEKYMMVKSEEDATGSKIWFLRTVVLVLLANGGVRMNLDPQLLHYEGQN
jgi:hypothetical protein